MLSLVVSNPPPNAGQLIYLKLVREHCRIVFRMNGNPMPPPSFARDEIALFAWVDEWERLENMRLVYEKTKP